MDWRSFLAAVVALIVGVAIGGCSPIPSGEVVTPARPTPRSSSGVVGVNSPGTALRYVALGDSYTIGTSETVEARWPNQLVSSLGANGRALDLVANIAVNGYTSRNVIDLELPQLDALRPGFLTLLIGVNDVVQGVPPDVYRDNLAMILADLVTRVGSDRVLVVTTPDYTVTPAGADYGDPATQAAEIRTLNLILSQMAEARGIAVVDIYDLSLRAATDRTLVASDGLHPSGTQYALWVERIRPVVLKLLAH